MARRALDEGRRYLVAVGGDGTVHEVVNGMFGADGEPLVADPVLGVVAAGSGGDLVKSFGLPGDVEQACGHLSGDAVYPFDVMKITYEAGEGRATRYAANLAEVGLGAEIARRAARMPTRFANLRRFVSFWGGFASAPRVPVKVGADRKEFEGRAFNVIVANAQFTSGGLRMSPRSFPGDGVLDALVFTGPRSDAYTMLPRIFRHGDHVPDEHITELRAKIRVSVESERPLRIVADGEPLGTTPATFQVVPQRILLKL